MNEIITTNTTLTTQPTFTNLADEYIDYLQVKESRRNHTSFVFVASWNGCRRTA